MSPSCFGGVTVAEKEKNENKDNEKDKSSQKKSEKEGIKSKGKYSKVRLAAAGIVVLIALLLILVRVINFNRSPLIPNAISPQSGSEVNTDEVTLKWQDSDPDGDEIYYDLYLSVGDGDFKKILNNSTATSYVIKIVPGTEYKWKVVAKDGKGGITEGPVWTFHSKENNPPAVPIALNPQVGETISSTKITLSWDCHDIDGDSLQYKVFLDGRLVTTTKETNYKISVDYGDHTWRVEAIDSKGAKSEGGPWSFSVIKINHPPIIDILYPKGEVKGESVTLKWAGKDPDGDKLIYKVYLNERLIEETNNESTNLKLKPGKYTLKIVVTDGKVISQAEVNFVVSTEKKTNIPPLTPFGPKPYNGATVQGGKIVLSWASEDMDSTKLTYDLYIDGKLVSNNLAAPRYSGTFSIGKHIWQVVVKDDSGNIVKGPEWSFTVVKKQVLEKPKTTKVFVAGGIEGVYIVEVPTLKVLYNFSLFPAYSLSSYGKNVLIGNDRTLISMEVVGDYLKVQKTWDMPSKIMDVYVEGSEIYAAGKDFVYVNGKLYKIKNNGTFAISGNRIYLAVGNSVKVYSKNMKVLSTIGIGEYVKRVKISQNKLFVFTSGSFAVVENGKINRISLPSPEDAIYSKGFFYVADKSLGVVKLDSNLSPIDITNIYGAKRIWIYDKYIVAFGRGIYVLKDGTVMKKVGIGEDLKKVCGEYYATERKVYNGNRVVYEGEKIDAISCGKKEFAVIDNGFLVLNGKKLNYKGYDVGFYEGSYYVAGGDVTYIFNESGKFLSKYGKPSVLISKDGYAASYNTVWRFIDGKEKNLSSKAIDIDADIIVAVLEKNILETFSWNLNLISRINLEGFCVATKGNYIFVGVKDGIRVYKFKGSRQVAFIPLPDIPRDLFVDNNRLLIADGENGLVIYDISDPENPIMINDQYNMKVYDISW